MPNMEVALTCRARPVLNHSHIDLSGTSGGTARKNKVSGARCQVSDARCEGAHRDSEVPAGGLGTVRSEKTTFQAGMYMKTKRTRCQVSGARCQGAHLGWEVPAGALETCGAKKLRSKPECV